MIPKQIAANFYCREIKLIVQYLKKKCNHLLANISLDFIVTQVGMHAHLQALNPQ